MTHLADAARQLAGELTNAAWRLHTTGLQFADPFDPTAIAQITSAAATLTAQLDQDNDDQLAAEACTTILNALWPDTSPEHVDRGDWWRTPLGRLCARTLGRNDTDAVTQSVAAAMLGVTRGTIAQMVHRGTLDRHPDGGVLRSSILQRLAR